MSGKTGTPVCPVSQGGLYEHILAGVCTGNPLSHTHIHSYTQMNNSHASVRTHRLMTEKALSKVKYLRCLTELIDCDEPAPACLDAFFFPFPYVSLNFHFICTKIIWRNPQNWVFFLCDLWTTNPWKYPQLWCMAYCYYKYANLANPRWEYLIYNLLLYNYHFTTHSIWYLWWWDWKKMSAITSKTI